MPAQIISAAVFTGGAIMPSRAPMAMMEPEVTASMPIRASTGAMMEPADSTAAVEEPVIMPGNMMMSMIRMSKTAGTLWNFSMIRLLRASSAPESSITFMKIIAHPMVRMVST